MAAMICSVFTDGLYQITESNPRWIRYIDNGSREETPDVDRKVRQFPRNVPDALWSTSAATAARRKIAEAGPCWSEQIHIIWAHRCGQRSVACRCKAKFRRLQR